MVRVSSVPGYSSLDISTRGKKRVKGGENSVEGKQWRRRMNHTLVLAFGVRRITLTISSAKCLRQELKEGSE